MSDLDMVNYSPSLFAVIRLWKKPLFWEWNLSICSWNYKTYSVFFVARWPGEKFSDPNSWLSKKRFPHINSVYSVADAWNTITLIQTRVNIANVPHNVRIAFLLWIFVPYCWPFMLIAHAACDWWGFRHSFAGYITLTLCTGIPAWYGLAAWMSNRLWNN